MVLDFVDPRDDVVGHVEAPLEGVLLKEGVVAVVLLVAALEGVVLHEVAHEGVVLRVVAPGVVLHVGVHLEEDLAALMEVVHVVAFQDL